MPSVAPPLTSLPEDNVQYAVRHSMDTRVRPLSDSEATPHPLRITRFFSPPAQSTRPPPSPSRKSSGSKNMCRLPASPPPRGRSSSMATLMHVSQPNDPTKGKAGSKGQGAPRMKKEPGDSGITWPPGPGALWPQAEAAVSSAEGSSQRKSSGSSSSATVGTSSSTRDPATSWELAGENLSRNPTRLSVDLKRGDIFRRATTGGYSTKKKEKGDEFAGRVLRSQEGKSAHTETKTPSKGWKKRVFSKDFFSHAVPGNGKREKTSYMDAPQIPERSDSDTQTVITHRSASSSKVPSRSSTVKSLKRFSIFEDNLWQLDGMAFSTSQVHNHGGAAVNDSVIGILDGKVGGHAGLKNGGGQWDPPTLSLDLDVVSEVDKMPVSVAEKSQKGREFWVSAEIQGKVSGDTQILEDKTFYIGLDVGVLLDVSTYTGPATFPDMKSQARKIVEAMDTSRDRVAVMTFSSPPVGKRRPSSSGRANVKVLNSSGSVAKKRLVESIENLEPGLEGDPTARDVCAAVSAAIKMLRNMPQDTSKYGAKRHPHLFLLTSHLDIGEIQMIPQSPYRDVKLHVVGLGPIFSPRSDMGGNGWCVSTRSIEPSTGLERVVFDGVEITVNNTQSSKGVIEMSEIVQNLRLGVNYGELTDVKVFLEPKEGCKIKTVMGETAFARILPGERRHVLVQLEAKGLPQAKDKFAMSNPDSPVSDNWGQLEQDLKATLGELKSEVLILRVSYRHSSFEKTVLTTQRTVQILRYKEDSVWAAAKDDMPEFFLDTWRGINTEHVRKALIQKIASSETNPQRAKRAVEKVATIRSTRGIDLLQIERELAHRMDLAARFTVDGSSRKLTKKRRAPLEPAFDGASRRSWSSGDDYVSDTQTWNTEEHLEGLSPRPLFESSHNIRPERRSPERPFRKSAEFSGRPPLDGTRDKAGTHQRQAICGPADSPDDAKKLWRDLRRAKAGKSGVYGSIRKSNSKRTPTATASSSVLEGELEIESELDFARMNADTGTGRSKRSKRDSEGGDTMLTLRDVHETDFSPWAL